MELIALENLKAVLDEYAAKAAELYRAEMEKGNHNASKDLVNSVTAQVNVDGNLYEVSVSLLEYWKYLEGGSKGELSSPSGAVYPAHFPPVSALERWIRVKPVLPRADANGRIPTTRQLAYLIGRKIKQHGIKPAPMLQNTIDELNREYRDRFVVALSSDVGVYINKVLHSLSEGRMSQGL